MKHLLITTIAAVAMVEDFCGLLLSVFVHFVHGKFGYIGRSYRNCIIVYVRIFMVNADFCAFRLLVKA